MAQQPILSRNTKDLITKAWMPSEGNFDSSSWRSQRFSHFFLCHQVAAFPPSDPYTVPSVEVSALKISNQVYQSPFYLTRNSSGICIYAVPALPAAGLISENGTEKMRGRCWTCSCWNSGKNVQMKMGPSPPPCTLQLQVWICSSSGFSQGLILH